jgi:chromosome segregation ATPase
MRQKEYKSPVRKLVAFFEKSRDSWKTKYMEAKYSAKILKNQVRYLKSRKRELKERVQTLEGELLELRSRLESHESESLKKRADPGPTHDGLS